MDNKSGEPFSHISYEFPKLGIFKWIIYLTSTFILSTLLYFPFLDFVENKIKSSLSSIPGCSIGSKDIRFTIFPPQIRLSKISIPRSCFGQFGSNLIINNTDLNFRGFTFSPFGPHFKIDTNIASNNIKALVTIGLNKIKVNFNDNTLDLNKLENEIKLVKLNGSLKLDGLLELSNEKIKDFKLIAKSTNFGLGPQNISGFKLDALSIKTLAIIANFENGKVDLTNFVIGDSKSPIRANFKGRVTINEKFINQSLVNLNGELAFSDSFIEKYSFVNMLLGRFDKKDNFYQIQVKGPIASPTLDSPRKE